MIQFGSKTDPLVAQQQKVAERENIDSIRSGVTADTDLKNRIFGGNFFRKLALGKSMGMTGG